MQSNITLHKQSTKLSIEFSGELTLYTISQLQKQTDKLDLKETHSIVLDLNKISFIDTAAAIYIVCLEEEYSDRDIQTTLSCSNETILSTLELVKLQRISTKLESLSPKNVKPALEILTEKIDNFFLGFVSFLSFLGRLFITKLYYLKSFKNIRFREIAFEINESAVKAFGIVSLTSFLIGLVVAYQSAYQLKLYGANIFIVDMLGISILRELAPLITAIVIAGRSGSAFTAQIGAMKITEELDAMRTMGFDPYVFLVMPRVIALMIAMPILIFIADIMGILGGMIVSNIDLGITTDLFIDRFREVVDAKHFFIGILKGPFFAFLIATIGIYRGFVVKNDTQSIGFNTTKSVVESIFAVIICDAVFSIAFTNLGI